MYTGSIVAAFGWSAILEMKLKTWLAVQVEYTMLNSRTPKSAVNKQ